MLIRSGYHQTRNIDCNIYRTRRRGVVLVVYCIANALAPDGWRERMAPADWAHVISVTRHTSVSAARRAATRRYGSFDWCA